MVLLDHTMNWCVCVTAAAPCDLPLPRSLAPSLALSHTHTVQLRQRRRRRWRRQRDSLLFSLRQKDLRPPCFCLDESATQRTPEAGPGTAKGSSKGKSQHSPSKQFLAGNNRLLSPLRAHLQCAANFTQSRAERGEGEGEEGRKKTATTGCSGARGRGKGPPLPGSHRSASLCWLTAPGGGGGGGGGAGKVDLESRAEFFNWTKPNALSSRGEKTTTEGGTGGFGLLKNFPSPPPRPEVFPGAGSRPAWQGGGGGACWLSPGGGRSPSFRDVRYLKLPKGECRALSQGGGALERFLSRGLSSGPLHKYFFFLFFSWRYYGLYQSPLGLLYAI
ncbi:protein SOGA3-like [Falco cherrug]|uniref:protein SOGA3-like n=1 Tax=Falco cherrug TaxID=345164 RepID=UPI002479A8A7|nr:protein SOGA3-like [Falco cherrug]